MKFNEIVGTEDSPELDAVVVLSPEEDVAFKTCPGAVLEDNHAEIQQSCRDLGSIDSAIADGLSSIERLDDLKEVVVQNPKLEEEQIDLIRATHESIMGNLGLSAVYTSESLNKGSVVATLEEAKVGIWQGIVSMLKKLSEMVMSFLAGFLKNTWILSKYLKFLESRVKEINDGPTEKTMPLFRPIAYKGRADFSSAYSIGKDAVKMTGLALETVGVMQQFQGTLKQTVSKSTKEYESSSIDKPLKYEDDAVVFDDKKLGLNNFSIDGGGVGALSGNRQFDNATLDTSLVTQSSKYPVPKSSDVLTSGEMKNLLNEASKIIDGIKKVESKKSIIKSVMDSVINLGMEIASLGQGKNKVPHSQTAYYRRIVVRMTKSYLGEAFRSAKALLDYVRVSLKYFTFTKETDHANYPDAPMLSGPKVEEKIHKVDWELA